MTDWASESFEGMRQQKRLDDLAEALIRQSIEHSEGYRMNHEPHYRARIMMLANDMGPQLGLPRNIAVQYALRFTVINDLLVVGALDADRLAR